MSLTPVRITPNLYHPAAQRLVSQANGDLAGAAARLVHAADSFGIDLGLVHATVDTVNGRPRVRQACLPVLGSGRTAMMFISEPGQRGDPDGEAAGRAERAACVRAVCEFLAKEKADEVRVAQGLPDPGEHWGVHALMDSGFTQVGRLSYMRRPIGDRTGMEGASLTPTMPAGISLVELATIDPKRWDELLIAALDRTYIETMDCPELCGMRTTADILASHKATGEFDPSLWWLIMMGEEAHGCLLLTRCPEQRTLELVYLGLSPQVRGKGISRPALSMGILSARARCQGWNVACAVDQRNQPALKLYSRLGFRSFAERVAIVRVLGE